MFFSWKIWNHGFEKTPKIFFFVQKKYSRNIQLFTKKNKIFFFVKKNKVGIQYSKKIPKCVLRITYTILHNYLTNKQGIFDRLFPYYTSKLCVCYAAEETRNLQAICFLLWRTSQFGFYAEELGNLHAICWRYTQVISEIYLE